MKETSVEYFPARSHLSLINTFSLLEQILAFSFKTSPEIFYTLFVVCNSFLKGVISYDSFY
jgi:hypothetical protein